MRATFLKRCAVAGVIIGLAGCSLEAARVTMEATDAASSVFKEVHDEGRIKRDAVASRRLGELTGGGRLTAQEVQPLKRIVAEAKANGKVTPEGADRILLEMERVVARHRE